jgi:hypothetical protein
MNLAAFQRKKTMSPRTWTFTGSSSFESLNTIVQEIWPGRVPCSTDPKPPLTGSVVVRAPSSSAHCELAGSARGNATTGDKPEGPSADPERPLFGRYRGLKRKTYAQRLRDENAAGAAIAVAVSSVMIVCRDASFEPSDGARRGNPRRSPGSGSRMSSVTSDDGRGPQ